jgi:hypothetical protein
VPFLPTYRVTVVHLMVRAHIECIRQPPAGFYVSAAFVAVSTGQAMSAIHWLRFIALWRSCAYASCSSMP